MTAWVGSDNKTTGASSSGNGTSLTRRHYRGFESLRAHHLQMQPKSKGLISETVIAAELLKLGVVVSKPLGDNASYDLIVDVRGKLNRIQCKTGKLRDGKITSQIVRVRRNTKKYRKVFYTKRQIDYFMIYCPETNQVYMLDVVDVGRKEQVTLMVKTTPRKNVRIAKDYELQQAWKALLSSSVVRAPGLYPVGRRFKSDLGNQ